jgi:hypothetical protein
MWRLALRSATYYWRTNLAVVLGVAAAVAVLGGALLVGDSVRGSLREIALGRLGRTDQVLSSAQFFREELAGAIASNGVSAAPLVVSSGFVTHEPTGRRAGGVVVYGVDERFWSFNGVEPPAGPAMSPALAAELGAASGDVILVRLQRPSEIPIESLFAKKEELGRTLRLTVAGVLPAQRLGEFALRPQQAELRAVFAPLRRVQRDLEVPGQVNTVIMAGTSDDTAAAQARGALALDDLGLKVRPSADGTQLIVDTTSGILSAPVEAAVREAGVALGLHEVPVFTYLANSMRIGERTIPYSLIAAVPLDEVSAASGAPHDAPGTDAIVLNEWTAQELNAKTGDALDIEYYLWDANAARERTAGHQPQPHGGHVVLIDDEEVSGSRFVVGDGLDRVRVAIERNRSRA